MNREHELKNTVREKYAAIASQTKESNELSCCGATACCSPDSQSIMAEDYSRLPGYNPDADLGLGCGLPTPFAKIRKGDTVVDLGSGAGNDCFVARSQTGESGRLIGIDFTPAMIEKARENARKLGYDNIEFRQGDIEDIPMASHSADVVISNCVLNLVPDKEQVFREIFRILKPGAHFSISDIVLEGDIPEKWKQVAELHAGCITGAIQMDEYLGIIREQGFTHLQIQREKEINLPDEVLLPYFSADEISDYRKRKIKIKSITVYAERPAKEEKSCCTPGQGCCN